MTSFTTSQGYLCYYSNITIEVRVLGESIKKLLHHPRQDFAAVSIKGRIKFILPHQES